MFKRHLGAGVLLICLGLGLWNVGHGMYLYAKAALAQKLLQQAWAVTLQGGKAVRPWPWADTYPIARLTTAHRVDLIVLAGASGRSMAFGPGHLDGTPLPGQAGNSVLSAHRDTHFAFLRQLQIGDALQVQTPKGSNLRYSVQAARVVDKDDLSVLVYHGVDQLTLITCYPFNAVQPGGRLRYVVTARRVPEATTMSKSEMPAPQGKEVQFDKSNKAT